MLQSEMEMEIEEDEHNVGTNVEDKGKGKEEVKGEERVKGKGKGKGNVTFKKEKAKVGRVRSRMGREWRVTLQEVETVVGTASQIFARVGRDAAESNRAAGDESLLTRMEIGELRDDIRSGFQELRDILHDLPQLIFTAVAAPATTPSTTSQPVKDHDVDMDGRGPVA